MSKTNGRIDYGRLLTDIDFERAFEGTKFEQYTDESEGGLGSTLGGWIGAAVGRFVGMALGQVAQELVVDELFGRDEDESVDDETETESDADQAETDESATDDESTEQAEDSESDESEETNGEPAEADAE